jgi:hypothetical protein
MKKSIKKRKRHAGSRSLSAPLWERVTREARLLGLTREEYIRLLLSFSGIVRNSVPGAKFNAAQLLNIVENPLFQAAFSFIAQSTLARFGEDNDASEEQGSAPNESNSNPESNRADSPNPTPRLRPQPPTQQWPHFGTVPQPSNTPRQSQQIESSDTVPPQDPFWEYW